MGRRTIAERTRRYSHQLPLPSVGRGLNKSGFCTTIQPYSSDRELRQGNGQRRGRLSVEPAVKQKNLIAVRSPLQLGTHLPPQSARAVGFAGQSIVPQTFACLLLPG